MRVLKKFIFLSVSRVLPLIFTIFLVPIANIALEKEDFTYFTTSYLVFSLLSSIDLGLGSFLLSKLKNTNQTQLFISNSFFFIGSVLLVLFVILSFNVIDYSAFHKISGLLIFTIALTQILFNLTVIIYNINENIYLSSIFNVVNITLKLFFSILSLVLFKSVEFVFLSIGLVNIVSIFIFFNKKYTALKFKSLEFPLFLRGLLPFVFMFFISYVNSNYEKFFVELINPDNFSTYSILISLSVVYLLIQSTFTLFVLKSFKKEAQNIYRVLFFFLYVSILIYSFSFFILSIFNTFGWFNFFRPVQLEFIGKIYSLVFATAAFYSLQVTLFQLSVFKENIRIYVSFSFVYMLLVVPTFYIVLKDYGLIEALLLNFIIVAVSTLLLNLLAMNKLSEGLSVKKIGVYLIPYLYFFLNSLAFVFGSMMFLFIFLVISCFFSIIIGVYQKDRLKSIKVLYEF